MVLKNIWKIMTLVVLLSLTAASCVTTVNVAVARPPVLNTAGIKRIAVMPFEADSRAYREMAQYATTAATGKIRGLNYFTLIDHSEIERLRRNNQSIETYVDALFTGRITRVDTSRTAEPGSYITGDGKTVYYTTYTSNAELEFTYSIVLARDGRLLGPVSKSGTASNSSQDDYPPVTELLRSIVDNQLGLLGRDLVPHTVMENRTFASEKSKDKVLKTEMKEALALVKEGSYKTALETYLGIYGRYKNIAAAENVSILHELSGETQTAADFMRRTFDETGNPRARDILARLNKILLDQSTIASEYSDTRSQVERAAAFASGEIMKVLPKNAKVWVYNNSFANDMAEAVTDNITAGFIQKGIAIVDRRNAALIEAEQAFQMSGSVSDNDFITIGNAAGANTIVVIGITGTGAMRRLQVRVLDIERRTPIMQSDTGEQWQL